MSSSARARARSRRLAYEIEIDVLEARTDDLQIPGLATEPRAQPGDHSSRRIRAFRTQLPGGVAPAHDRHTRIRAADLVHRTDVDQQTLRDHGDPIAQLRRLIQIVRRQQDRGPLPLEPADQLPEI